MIGTAENTLDVLSVATSSEPDGESGWLLYHSIGRFPGQQRAVARALDGFSETWFSFDDQRWAKMSQKRARAAQLWGRALGVHSDTIFPAENVTSAFAHFFESLPAQRLRNKTVLITDDCFPSLHFLLSGLADHLGFRLQTVATKPEASYVQDDDYVAAWTEDVAVAMINWVSSTSSKRADLDRLVAHGRSMGSLIALDVTQAVGILPINLETLRIDFAAGTCLKWLCGVPGAGFAYVAPELVEKLEPRFQGWFSQPDPNSWDLDRFRLAPDIRRFWHGTPSSLPYLASLPGLEWVMEAGIEPLSAHNRALCARLIEICDHHRLRLASPRSPSERGGSIMVDLTYPARADALRRALAARNFHTDLRGHRVRWSPGNVTTAAAVDMFDVALGEALRTLT